MGLGTNYSIEPSEPGIHCEACHGPGAEHVRSGGRVGTILNPKRLSAAGLNDFCGVCHRKAPESDWTDKWKTRHRPSYLAQAACFRMGNGKLTCLTCHDPHSPLNEVAAQHDKRCTECHPLGSLLESAGQLAEAEREEREAMRIFEQKLGPWSAELATSCANLADILWTKGDRASAAGLYQRSISIDESVYGAGNPEVAGDLVSYGTLLRESGQAAAAEQVLRRALVVYEKALGPASPEAARVRQLLQ